MPAISGPFGPIVEPGWIGGAQMPGQPDLVQSYQNAWQIHASINAKTQQYENQLMIAALKARDAQNDNKRGGFLIWPPPNGTGR
jgi:hypothetical protein